MLEISKNKLNRFAQLGSAKLRRKYGLFRAEGEKCVADTIGGFEVEAVIALKEWWERAMTSDIGSPAGRIAGLLASESSDKRRVATESELKKLSSMSNVPQVVAVYRLPAPCLPEFPLPDDLYLILDGVQDPGNLGTIVRTCHWFGIKAIFASRETADIYNSKAIQATMGSVRSVPVHYVELDELLDANPHIPLYATALNGENIYSVRLTPSGFIALGSEGHGISERIAGRVAEPLFIPPYDSADHSESLNVGIATAIVLSQFRRNALMMIR